jgi:hypothetical protein
VPAAVLALPDVAQLVGDQVVARAGDGLVAQDDRPPERVPAVAPHLRQPEERRRDDDAHAAGAHGRRIGVEPVEARLRPLDERLLLGAGEAAEQRA